MSDRLSQVNVLFRTKIFCDGNTIEVLADLTVVDWCDVKEKDESDKDENAGEETDPQQDQLSSPLVDSEGDERQDCVRDEEAEDEAKEVGVVVDPGEESGEEEDCGDPDQFEYRHLRVLERRPLVDDLHNAAGQEAEVRPGRTDLSSVGHEDGAGEVPDHAGA